MLQTLRGQLSIKLFACKIASAFKSTGMFLFNPNIFTNDMLLPAKVNNVTIASNFTPD